MPHDTVSSRARVADYPVASLFLERWSPRAFTEEPVSRLELLTMLEAARWAASSYNGQPWRFVFAIRDTPPWQDFLSLLAPGNQVWAHRAAALVFFVSRTCIRKPGSDADEPLPTHAYDTGAASASFTLQAHLLGWAAHGMVGFDRGAAAATLAVPSDCSINAVYAVGRAGNAELLPEHPRQREHPSGRAPLGDLAFEGRFAATERPASSRVPVRAW